MRRFHLAYDDEERKQEKVVLRCPHCQVVIFRSAAHPDVRLLREENLTKVSEFGSMLVDECAFKDNFT